VSQFHVNSSKQLLQTPHWSVEELDITGPNGEPMARQVLRHPGAVTVVPVDEDGNTYLVRQYRAAFDDMVLESCAGRMDKPGEDPADCAARELREELGMEATSFQLLSSLILSPGYCDEVNHLFLATGLSQSDTEADGVEEEYMEIVTMPLAGGCDAVRRGEIADSKTAVALLLAEARLL
jgi:ADP-ribose pyrophosphatase